MSKQEYGAVSVGELREQLSTVISRVLHRQEPIMITRHGAQVAALVPVSFLLENLEAHLSVQDMPAGQLSAGNGRE